MLGKRDGIALDDQVDVRPVRDAEDGVAHGSPHQAHPWGTRRPLHAGEHGIPLYPPPHGASIVVMGDHVADNLSASAPIALDGLQEAIARWEGCSLDELRAASDRIQGEVRQWATDPVNAERPISDAPVYLDRMAVEVLIERRYFTE
jgi:hypothetical protein